MRPRLRLWSRPPLLLLLACAAHTVGTLPGLCDVLRVLREERDQCLQELSKEKPGDLGTEQPAPGCEGLWDNMSCWPSSALGRTVEVGCPPFLQMLTGRNGSMFRNCTQDGWSETFPRPDLACGVNVNDSSNEERVSLSAPLSLAGGLQGEKTEWSQPRGKIRGPGAAPVTHPTPLIIRGSLGLPHCPGLSCEAK
ncbi:secretin receptor-like, partial [Leptonychotes weddellii]|uniref:Secretin receptor-like n=1 Tax=Leptonychotes weddellii TaxID=9713 RepID=A0A7F8R191_LEPWE